MATMEAWLAELEMEEDEALSLINNPCYQYNQCERMETTIAEQFHYPNSSESNISSPEEWNIDKIFIDPSTPPLEIFNNNDINYVDNNINNNKTNDEIIQESPQIIKKDRKDVINRKEASRGGGAKRKRAPSQVQDHIIAERKRRELLSQLFISLSTLVPGLKKVDKTSVLGEAIKYMKQLQENVKSLEEVVAKRAVESVVIKKSQFVVSDHGGNDNENSFSTTEDHHCSSGCSGGDGGSGGESSRELDNVSDSSLPEIEVKMSSDQLLLKIYCENKKGIMTKLFRELEKHDLTVSNCSVVPFESLTLDITIVAQMERGFDMNVRSFAENVRSVILS